MSPARAAVLGNVLVPQIGKVVCVVDIIPNPLVWEGHRLKGALNDWSNRFGALSAAGVTSVTD
jgi:hypothetical protein